MAAVCSSCGKPKAQLQCCVCDANVCKNCAQIVEEETFSFLSPVPKDLKSGVYCPSCFDSKIAEALNDYQETMEKAREILVYFKKQSKETRLISRKEAVLKVENVIDEDEAVLRLAFKSAQKGFNAIIDVETSSEKIRNAGYQTLKWKASGIPANVDESRIPKDKSIRDNPN